jgi:hypothetical protein
MRTRFWVSAFLLSAVVGAVAQQAVSLPSGATLTYAASGAETVFTIQKPHGRRLRFRVERDATIAPGTAPISVSLVAEIPNSALILTDTYPSIPGGMSYCQAGEERFLRVISLNATQPVETYHVKLESCRDNVELASPGVEWLAGTRSLRIHWLSAPGQAGKPETRTVNLTVDGKPTS